MEQALRRLYDLLSEPEVLEDDTIRIKISELIMILQTIIASRKKTIIKRPS